MSKRYSLFRDTDVVNGDMGTPVPRLDNFNREMLFNSTFKGDEYQAIMMAMDYLDNNFGIISVEFKAKTGNVFFLKKSEGK